MTGALRGLAAAEAIMTSSTSFFLILLILRPSLNITLILFVAPVKYGLGGAVHPGSGTPAYIVGPRTPMVDRRAERGGLRLPPNAPATARNLGDAGAMDFARRAGRLQESAHRVVDTLGAAPLAEQPGFRNVVLGAARRESRSVAAIDTEISGEQAHSGALDTDPKGPPARHPPARRHRDSIRVLRRADR
jgi:hypothetical protein